MPRSLYLAAYDVRSAKRLRHALQVARSFASGGQKSAHECWLEGREKGQLLNELTRVILPDTDRVALIPLDPRRSVITLGRALKPANPNFFYFG